jgi:CheY-like chemotaxis protein
VRVAESAGAALGALDRDRFDCLILDLTLPDMDGLELLERVRSRAEPPAVVVHTARSLPPDLADRLEAMTEAVIVKEGRSTERLIEELRLFVRRLEQPAAADGRGNGVRLDGRKLLIADDDMRTVYALAATLRARGAEVLVAENGRAAIDALEASPDVDAVLMDVMMPEMDGYEAMRRLRRMPRFERLPIVAITAKAMGSDRERCMAAGASDYLAKPIDADRLVTLLRAHLP